MELTAKALRADDRKTEEIAKQWTAKKFFSGANSCKSHKNAHMMNVYKFRKCFDMECVHSRLTIAEDGHRWCLSVVATCR